MTEPYDGDKKLKKKIKIIETAYQLFRTKSVSDTAIDDVVKAAGIARGTFYLYFKDKSDLLEQIIMFKSTESMKQLLENARITASQQKLDVFSMSRLFIDMYIDFLVSHKDVLMVVTKNISSCLKHFPDIYDNEVTETYLEIVKMFTNSGWREEVVHKTVYIVIDMIGSVCSDAILYGHPFTIDEIRSTITEAAMCIIYGAAKGENNDANNS